MVQNEKHSHLMLVNNNNTYAYGGTCRNKTSVENRAEDNMAQNIIPYFIEGRLCYESFFMDCLSRPKTCSSFFVSAFGEILEGLLALQSCSVFVQERDLTYLFNGLAFLYVECECGTFKSKFVNLLSALFVKREPVYTRYRFMHKYTTFKALLSLIRQGDFRIREFMYNTDFVDVLFELPGGDPMMLMLKWKFVNVVATNADIGSSVLERESVKSFVGHNMTTSFGAVNSLIKDTLQNANKNIEHLLSG